MSENEEFLCGLSETLKRFLLQGHNHRVLSRRIVVILSGKAAGKTEVRIELLGRCVRCPDLEKGPSGAFGIGALDCIKHELPGDSLPPVRRGNGKVQNMHFILHEPKDDIARHYARWRISRKRHEER